MFQTKNLPLLSSLADTWSVNVHVGLSRVISQCPMLKMNGFSEHPLFWFPDLFHPLKLRGEALFIEPSSIGK